MIKKKFGKIVSISKGKKHSTAEAVLPSSRRIIGINDLRNDDKIAYTNDRIGTEVFPEDIMIAWDGANAGTIGFGKTGFIGSTIARLRLKEKNKFHTAFIGAFLKTQFDYLRKTATGATIPHISRSALERIEIPQFEINDQIRIATLLSRIEVLIATRKNKLSLLNEFLKSTFRDMFGDPVRNEKGWDKRKIKDIAYVRIGPFGSLLHADDYIENGVPLINPSHIIEGIITPDNNLSLSREKYLELSSYHLKENDLVVARRGEIGRCAIVKSDEPLFCGTGSMFVRIQNDYLPLLLQFQIYYTSLRNYLESKAKGVTMKNLNSNILGNLEILNPPPSLQNHFASIVKKVESLKTLYQQSLNELENLYGALSQKAFKGELDLSRIPLEKVPEEAISDAAQEIVDQVPEPDNYVMSDPTARENLLRQLFDVFIQERRGHTFSMEAFWTQVEQKVLEHMDDESPPLGVVDYDKARAWLFELLESGRIDQRLDEKNNRMELNIKS